MHELLAIILAGSLMLAMVRRLVLAGNRHQPRRAGSKSRIM